MSALIIHIVIRSVFYIYIDVMGSSSALMAAMRQDVNRRVPQTFSYVLTAPVHTPLQDTG